MADKILKQNKIPGCERLTRPEEIKALSKYLRNIRQKLEENTDLEETTLEIPGKTTGQIHDISELPDGYDRLDVYDTINSLETEKINIEDPRENSLSNYIDNIEDDRENVLSDYQDTIEDNRENTLSDYIDNIEDSREPSLSDYQDTIVDDRENTLSNYIDNIEDDRTNSLSNYIDNIEDSRENSLSDYQDTIVDEIENTLSNYQDTIEDNRENTLSDYIDNIEDNRENVLSDYQDTIVDDRENTLSNYIDNIEDRRENSLSNYQDTIEDNRENTLSDYIDTIEDNRKNTLSDYIDIIEDNRKNVLSDYQDTIVDERKPKLSDYQDTIVDDRENSLSNYQDTIVDNRETSLSNYIDNIEDRRENSLSDYQDTIEDNRKNTLSDYIDIIEDNRKNTLSDYQDTIVDERKPKLSDYQDTIEDNRENTLSDYIDNIEDNRENTLSNYIDNIEDRRENVLSDYQDTIEDNRENTLSDYIDNIEDNRKNVLSDYQDTIVDERKPKLSDYQDTIVDDRENSLSDYQDTIVDNRENVLSDYQDTIVDDRENTLSDYIDNIEDNRENVLSDYQDTIVDERKPKLSDYQDTIVDDREPSLSDYQDTIVDERKPKLSDYQDTIVDDREPSLSDYQDTIVDDRENTLSDYQDTIVDERENVLSDYQDTIVDERENVLSDYQDTIEDERENSLSDYQDTIVDERENTLSDYQDTIVDERENTLSDYQDTIVDEREPSLSDYQDTIVDEREPSLSDYQDTIVDEREPSLEDFINQLDEGEFKNPVQPTTNLKRPDSENQIFNNEWNTDGSPGYYGSWDDVIPKLVDEREPELEDTLVLKNAVYNPETGTFSTDGLARTDGDYDYIDNEVDYNEADPIIQLKIKNKFDNHQKLVERPDNREDEARTDGVFPNNEWNDDGSPGYYGSWDDVIPKIPDSKNQNPIYEQLLGLDENELYTFVLQVLNDREHDSDLNIDSEWKEKIAGLVSAYLNPSQNTPISPKNAHRFENELFRSVQLLDEDYEYREEQYGLGRNTDGEARIDGRYDYIDYTDTNERTIKHHQEKVKMDSTYNSETETLETDGDPRSDSAYDYINYNDTTEDKIDEHTKEQYKDIPPASYPNHGRTELLVEYIRYWAEQFAGNFENRTTRKYLLSAALLTLLLTRYAAEKSTNTYRSRLPGNSSEHFSRIETAISDANDIYQSFNGNIIESIINSSLSLFSKYLQNKPNPINRPKLKLDGGPKETTGFEYGNSRTSANSYTGDAAVTNRVWENIKSDWNSFLDNFREDTNIYDFTKNYLTGCGIATTLSDLCNGETIKKSKKDKAGIGSLEDLLETLRNSEYITTPEKFGTTKNRYGTQTLDSNAYWELIIEPLCDVDLNGGWSFLPCFQEINALNWLIHGVNTSYNKWIPIINFELQKSKLTTKSVGLFDGEFSFPLSAEFTNELRMTIVDDQYKSWRHYFQKCMDVAVYNSTPHNSKFYPTGGLGDKKREDLTTKDYLSTITAVDKSITCVSFYKNITFRIRIYIMTPQYSTIRRFDLLCVLKDFMEEYSGDVDAGGVDLNVTFSIVGENPDGAKEEKLNSDFLKDLENRLEEEKKEREYQEYLRKKEDVEQKTKNLFGINIFDGGFQV